jgi:hypothetical protein
MRRDRASRRTTTIVVTALDSILSERKQTGVKKDRNHHGVIGQEHDHARAAAYKP